MKTYRIFIENTDPREYNDAEKVVVNNYEPTLYDIRLLTTLIGTQAYVLTKSTPICMIGKAIEECVNRAVLTKEEFPIAILYKNTSCLINAPEEGEFLSIAARNNKTIIDLITKEAK